MTGLANTDGITVANGVITLTKANLNGENVSVTEGEGYTPAIGDDVKDIPYTEPTVLNSGEQITASGIYVLDENFRGTVEIASTAKNVKIIGADGKTYSALSIDASNVDSINLWIENLNVSTTSTANVIKFGSGDNTLIVNGENTLARTSGGTNALVHIGSGNLNIVGDGALTASIGGSTATGAVIGLNNNQKEAVSTINIGGGVTIKATNNGLVSAIGVGGGQTATLEAITIGGRQK